MLVFLALLAAWAALALTGAGGSEPNAGIAYLQDHLEGYRLWSADHPTLMPLIVFAAIFISALVGFPPPGLVTVCGSALIGFQAAFFIALPAAAIGAVIPFLTARHLLLSRVVRWFPDSHAKFQKGIKDDLEFYLFSLRLVPLVPFPLINIFMGITEITPWRFFLITFAGRIPLTFLYCSAGIAISELHSLSDIFSPRVTLVLLALALLPHIAKYFLNFRGKNQSAA